MSNLQDLFGNDFPQELISSSYDLSELGSSNFAWGYEDILRVIEYCYEERLAILGGDVLCLSDAGIDYEVRSVHCKCIHCGMFTMFTSNLGATPFEDGYHCDNPDCEFCFPDLGFKCHIVQADPKHSGEKKRKD